MEIETFDNYMDKYKSLRDIRDEYYENKKIMTTDDAYKIYKRNYTKELTRIQKEISSVKCKCGGKYFYKTQHIHFKTKRHVKFEQKENKKEFLGSDYESDSD